MKIKTAELAERALDYAVCVAGAKGEVSWTWFLGKDYALKYSTDWGIGGPIIEREWIELFVQTGADDQHRWAGKHHPIGGLCAVVDGPTSLVAAMRCYIVSRLGNEVEVPDELC